MFPQLLKPEIFACRDDFRLCDQRSAIGFQLLVSPPSIMQIERQIVG